MGAFFLICPAASSYAQLDPAQLVARNEPRSQTVSRNQLLAPVKALRAIERAQKDTASGKLDSAQKEIARALEVAPHFAVAKVLQGAIDLETENYQGATTSFQQAIDDDPSSGAAYVGMSVILIHERRFQAALPLLDRAEGLLPAAWFVHFAEALTQFELGNAQAALKQTNLAEQIAGTDAEKRSGVSYLRAIMSIHLNDMAAAREHLAEAIARDRGGAYAEAAKKELERLQPLSAAIR